MNLDTSILILRTLGVLAFMGSTIVSFRLWWRVRGLRNAPWFALTATASGMSVAALSYLAGTTATDKLAVLVANVGVAMAVAGWSLVGGIILRQAGTQES